MLEPWHIDEIAPGVTREWSATRRIVIFRLMDYKREAIDLWTAAIEETIVAENRPHLLVYHFATIPPSLAIYYLQQKFRQLDAYAGEQLGKLEQPIAHTYIAVVPPRQFAPVANFIIARQATVRRTFGLTVQAFGTLDGALEWLVSREE